MKFFESTTVHYETKNGKTTGTKEHVVVNGTKGTKTVEDIENQNNSVESESLSKKEIENIMKRVFVPNLFSSLHILNQSNLFRMNNNTKKNNNNNNSKKNSASNITKADVGHMLIRGNATNEHASKKRTRKHRRQ
jgi:hypothetical protein